MKAKALLSLVLVVVSSAATAPSVVRAAVDVVGVWQATLQAKRPLRIILKITKDNNGALTALLYSIDQSADPIPVSSVKADDDTLTMTVAEVHGAFAGRLSADGNSVAGTWKQGRSFPLSFLRATKATMWPTDPSVKITHFVTVEPGVQLEVLDWGGTGKPIVLLAGQGNTAHIFSNQGFARALTSKYHVYGITRRGFGESSKPAPIPENYSADRLGDDDVAIINALHLNRPVLIGHSLAGEELSSVGTHHPESTSGLVYLDSGYAYALYDVHASDFTRLPFDSQDVTNDLRLNQSEDIRTQKAAADRLLAELPRLQNDLRLEKTFNAALGPMPPVLADPIDDAINAAGTRYVGPISVPILAIYAAPHDWSDLFGTNAAANAAATQAEYQDTLAQIGAFKQHFPSATVVVISNADHFVFVSNREETLRDINAFLNHVWPDTKSSGN